MNYDIFISYKRLGASSATAAYLYEILQQKGYNVFFDRKEMRSGKFNEQLLEHIQTATDVIILLEKDSLRAWFDHRVPPKGKSFDDDDAVDLQEEPYKTDWFCKEITYALGIPGKNIIPILLEGYLMPAEKDLPPEMKELSNYQALTLDISETSEFYEKYLVGPQPYLRSKPTNLSLSRRVQSKGGIVGRFLFYTEAESCDLYECGELVATLTDDQDEWHPFCYPVDFAGEHRFRVVNNDSCEVLLVTSSVETYCQQYVHVQFSDIRNLWTLTTEEIAAQEDADLLTKWGKGLFDGTSKHQPDIALSFECLQRAILLGGQEALSFVGSYGAGLVDQKQAPVEVAVKWYRIAAEQGNADAQINLGNAYTKGASVEQDDAKAVEWYMKAAEQGAARAQWLLGNRYRRGRGIEQDVAKAFEWYSKAAERGFAPAQRNLGHLYRDGLGVERDYRKAFELYVKAAEQGDVYAQLNLGNLYQSGRGVRRDYGKAFEWYGKAAEKGFPPAQYRFGCMYEQGRGVGQDLDKALEWLLKAGEQGEKRSYNSIAWIYHLKGDFEKALPWAEKALEAFPDRPYVVDTMATVYEDLGRYDEALEQFEKCLQLCGNDEPGKQRTVEKIDALKKKMNR